MLNIVSFNILRVIAGLSAVVVVGITFQNCSQFHQAQLKAVAGSSYCNGNTADKACLSSLEPTCIFNGAPVANGQAVTAYFSSSVVAGSSCQSQSRICTNGTLSGTYSYPTCGSDVAAACLFNGSAVASGFSVDAYLNSTDPTCRSEKRNCANGVLSGSFSYATCTSSSYKSCLFNGQTLEHGQSVSAFANSQVAFGQTCTPITRTCFNGALSATGDFGSCSVSPVASCLFNGTTIVSGSSTTAYASSSLPFGQSCVAQTRVCANGILSGSGDFASCSIDAPVGCLINGQTVNHGSSITLYLNSSVGSGENCQTQLRTCSNGTLSGNATAATCTPTAVLCGADVVNNPNVDATPSLQACINTSTPLIELVPGRYYLNSRLVFSNRTAMTIRTQNLNDGPACFTSGAAPCAILIASQSHNGPTIFDSYSSNNLTLNHIVFDGNNAVRRAIHPTNDWQEGIAYNSRIHDCAGCNFIGLSSVRAPQGTGLEFSGDNATFDHCLFRDNGWGLPNDPSTAWSDGLTVHSSSNIRITNSIFKDNSDINLILGNAPGAVIQNNWIGNTYNFAYGALMLDNFGGSKPGNFTGAVINNNTIDCGQGFCGIGINIGPQMWYSAPQVIGGAVYSNSVVGARQGILTNGATGWDIYSNTVNVLGIYTDGHYSTNFISYSNGDSVNIHDNSQAAQLSGLMGMSPQNLPLLYSNFNGTSAAVSKAYREVLGRDPDLSGGPAYTNAVASGRSIDSVRTELAISGENAAKINSIYLHVFGRSVDDEGLTNWRYYLMSGGSVDQMWVQFELSPEGLQNSDSFNDRQN